MPDEQIASRLQGQFRWRHHPPPVHLGVGLGRAQAGLGDLQVLDDLGDHLLHLLLSRRPQRLGHQRCQSQHELALGHVLGHHLVSRVQVPVGSLLQVVAQLHIAQQEYVLPWHEDMIEESHRVQFLEPGTQRVVEVRLAVVEALPALVAQARSIVGYGEGESIRLRRLLGEHVRGGGIQRDLLRQRGQRRQHPRAVDIDSRVGLLLHPQGDVGAVLQGRRARRPAALQVEQRVGQHQVVLPDVLVVVVDVVLELRPVLRRNSLPPQPSP